MPTEDPGDGITIVLDPEAFGRMVTDIKGFDKKLYSNLRKELRRAGESAVLAVRDRVLSGEAKTDTGLRRGIAAGTKVSISGSVSRGGVSIKTTGNRLPPDKRAMVKAYNKSSFRHPVFGDPQVWLVQTGRPYFGHVLDDKKPEMEAAVRKALYDAVSSIRGAKVE